MANARHGISFAAVPPPLADRLPRMDVAGFVGFASSGPLDTPVLIEDQTQFQAIFGGDLPLAWDEAEGREHCAFLGPAVRAFFQNGGRRCWVVRVASPEACANTFPVPGLFRYDGSVFSAALSQARSPGSWSDDLRVSATLQSEPLGAARLMEAPPREQTLELTAASAARPVAPGDLLHVTWPGHDLTLFLAIRTAAVTDRDQRVCGAPLWFRHAPAPLGGDMLSVQFVSHSGLVTAFGSWESSDPAGCSLCIDRPPLPAVGDPLTIHLIDGRTGCATVTTVEPLAPGSGWDSSGRATAAAALVQCSAPLWVTQPPSALPEGDCLAQRLSLDLMVKDGHGRASGLTGLGFLPQHPRYFGALPTDASLYRPPDPRRPVPDGRSLWEGLRRDAAEPRFPLAGLDSDSEGFCFPAGMAIWPDGKYSARALLDGTPTPRRNGLASLEPSLFLPGNLARQPAATLAAELFDRQHVLGQDLGGLYALWPVDEVTLICAPDAVHPPWTEDSAATPPPVHPPAVTLSVRGARLSWTAAPDPVEYLLEQAEDPLFLTVLRSSRGHRREASLPEVPPGCQRVLYFRVRPESGRLAGPWSNTCQVLLPEGHFAPCGLTLIRPPALTFGAPPGPGRHVLSWSYGGRAGEFVLEEADNPEFLGTRMHRVGPEKALEFSRTAAGATYYRVRAATDDGDSPWSNTVVLLNERITARWRVRRDQAGADCAAAVHRAMLRMATARGDLLALLALPQTLREQEAVTYVRELAADLNRESDKALTYGALYHPWLFVDSRWLPPDGAAAGRTADAALERGAWVSPANRTLAGPSALAPVLTDNAQAQLRETGVNVVARQPGGFVVTGAETLGRDPALQPIGVRRLLILLRRLALREGRDMVFEPTSEGFARRVRQRFESILTDLFVRGAFAGARAQDGFRVVTDASVNPTDAVERGMLVVELRVAPSRPLEFLQVRLVQAQGAAPVVAEV